MRAFKIYICIYRQRYLAPLFCETTPRVKHRVHIDELSPGGVRCLLLTFAIDYGQLPRLTFIRFEFGRIKDDCVLLKRFILGIGLWIVGWRIFRTITFLICYLGNTRRSLA